MYIWLILFFLFFYRLKLVLNCIKMPEAKAKDRISSGDGVFNLSEQLGAKDTDASMIFMVVPNDTKNNNSSTTTAAIADSPLNLVINTKHTNETLGLKCAPITATAKTPLPSQNFTTDISFHDPMTVPTNPSNKLNYFPKTVSNFQGVPVTGQFLQRFGPFQYNSTSSGAPLVAFVNPTATSVIAHGLKPVFTAPSSFPSVETMNQIVYNSMPSAKANMTQHPASPVILVRSSAPLSKSGNFQYVMASAEKTSTSFAKTSPQVIFGNESGKFIPVATIVPNNASLVTNSQKTVTSVLSGEPVLSTNDSKYLEQDEGKKIDSKSVEAKTICQNHNSPWHPNTSNHSKTLTLSSRKTKLNSTLSMSQPLNLTLQSVSDSVSKHNDKNIPFTDRVCKQKYSSGKSSPSPGLVFHSSTASPSPIIFNSAAYSLPTQNVYLSNASHINLQRGFSSQSALGNSIVALNSNTYLGSSQGRSIDLLKSKTLSSSPRITQITEKNGHDEPSMTLKIDSIFSLADKPGAGSSRPVNINQKFHEKIKVKNPTKLVCKEKKIVVQRPGTTLSTSHRRQPQKNSKHSVKKRPKRKYNQSNIQREITHSILARKAPSQKGDITVSCHANDFQSLHPMTEEERKLNTFFTYLGLCPSSSLATNDDCNNSGVSGGSANGRCNVSREITRCFSCYVVVAMIIVPEDFIAINVSNPPASVNIPNKCSKECRHAFLNKQHSTTGIVPRNGELDSCWKIILQTQKCSHTRKKYCRKSKTKASDNLTGSHCRRVGCIGCSTKKPTTHNKTKYFRKSSKDSTTTDSVLSKEQTRRELFTNNKQGGKKIYAFNKKSSHHVKRLTENKKRILETDATCMNVLGEKNIPGLMKRKANQHRHSSAKVQKKDVLEVENMMDNCDIIESESVDEISPLVSNFLGIEDPCHNDSSLIPVKKVLKPEPIALPQGDISTSSERIQRLKEILKEKQKDLEIARQLLL